LISPQLQLSVGATIANENAFALIREGSSQKTAQHSKDITAINFELISLDFVSTSRTG